MCRGHVCFIWFTVFGYCWFGTKIYHTQSISMCRCVYYYNCCCCSFCTHTHVVRAKLYVFRFITIILIILLFSRCLLCLLLYIWASGRCGLRLAHMHVRVCVQTNQNHIYSVQIRNDREFHSLKYNLFSLSLPNATEITTTPWVYVPFDFYLSHKTQQSTFHSFTLASFHLL